MIIIMIDATTAMIRIGKTIAIETIAILLGKTTAITAMIATTTIIGG
jgi:hypothetical protein